MTLWIGRRQAVGIAVESSRGVGVAPTYYLSCNSFSFADKPTRAKSDASFGGIWGGDQAPMTLIHAEGSFEVELGDASFGVILYNLFGSVSDGGTANGYTHTYTLSNDNQHKSITITTKDPIGNFTYELSMINSFELKVEPDKIVTYSVDFMSKGSADNGNTVTDSYGAEKKFVGRHLSLKLASTTSGLGAATASDIKSLSLKIDKNTSVESVLSTSQPIDIVNRKFMISGEIVLNYEDRTWLNLVKNGSYRAMRIALTHEDIVGGGSTPYSWVLDLSKVAFENFDPDFSLDNVVTQKLQFSALYDAGGNNNVVNSCILTNATVSY